MCISRSESFANAASRLAYGSVAGTRYAPAVDLRFAKPSSSSSSSSPPLPSPSRLPVPESGGSGGSGFEVFTEAGSWDGTGSVPGSIGPGPDTTIGPADGPSRCRGTRSCLDSGFSAGESTSALPAAPRMNVWPRRHQQHCCRGQTSDGRTSGFL
jgi:hypothetical protein